MIFIAIKKLNPNNRLSTSTKVEKLGSKENIVMNSDANILFSENKRRLALLLIINK